jgi:hypothetical protein
MFSLLPRSGEKRRLVAARNWPVACAGMSLSSSASRRERSSSSCGITLRDSIQPSVFVSSAPPVRTSSQRSPFSTTAESRISTTSPRKTSDRSAATIAVELRICARRAITTPVFRSPARVLQPAATSDSAIKTSSTTANLGFESLKDVAAG